MIRKTLLATLLFTTTTFAQPGAEPPAVEEELHPPGETDAAPPPPVSRPAPKNPLATTERWGGGVRLTGLSGIGALPGVNFGGELAVMVRRDTIFAELGFGRWTPEKSYVVTEGPEHVDLGLDVWSFRAGWASMNMPLRAWGLFELGELANMGGMPGVVTRMMTGDTPMERRWKAFGAGFGVAWPLADKVRLFGMIELAVPVNRKSVMLDSGIYEPDPLAARSSVGLEVGWR